MKPVPALLLIAAGMLAQEQSTPERTVQGNVIVSASKPPIRIELPREAVYVGADRWPLYGVADCELHVWVEASEDKVVSRLYWVQFEAYLPTKPDLRYKYPFTRTRELGGLPFDVRARFGASNAQPKPESDGGHLWALLKRAGYTSPQEMMNVRFVHLPDEQKRTELMIIYAEDLKPTGVKVADLEPGGSASERWPALERALIDRAAEKLQLSAPADGVRLPK